MLSRESIIFIPEERPRLEGREEEGLVQDEQRRRPLRHEGAERQGREAGLEQRLEARVKEEAGLCVWVCVVVVVVVVVVMGVSEAIEGGFSLLQSLEINGRQTSVCGYTQIRPQTRYSLSHTYTCLGHGVEGDGLPQGGRRLAAVVFCDLFFVRWKAG